MKIPIENVYYLLCYAWDKLQEKDQVKISVDDQTELIDLFAHILINGTRKLLKRGIDHNYISETVSYAGVKGKLEFSATIKSGLYRQQRTFCTTDEFSANVLPNRILLTTLYRLIKTKELDPKLSATIKPLIWMFSGIDLIELSPGVFKKIRLHRNNHFYGLLLQVCRMLYENTLPSEKPGEWIFQDFTRDENKMNRLFEAFLFNFYKREFTTYKIRRTFIYWKLSSTDEAHLKFLPRMETDIAIETDQSSYIIDAKYYRETLTNQYDTSKVQSANLYQLFSYLMNQRSEVPASFKTKGMLIYPTNKEEVDLTYWYDQHEIHIKTINLNMHWKLIEKRLKSFLQD